MPISINPTIRKLIYFIFIAQFSFELASPIFGVFILRSIHGAVLETVGIAMAMYWLARVMFSLPLSRLMDRLDGERDEYYSMLVGTFVASTIPLFYLFVTEPWHMYLLQFAFGIANSMLVPGWRILFTDHLDKGKTGFEWSFYDIAVGIAICSASYLGAVIADKFSFSFLFVTMAIVGYISTLLLIPLNNEALPLGQLRMRFKTRDLHLRRKNGPFISGA